jgi:hypothetical protein
MANIRDTTDLFYEKTWGTIKIRHNRSKKIVAFKAFIRRLVDSFSGGWQSKQFPNQSSPIGHQVNPRRQIHIEWAVPAYDEEEANLHMQKCSFLANITSPNIIIDSTAIGEGTERIIPQSSFWGLKFANLVQSPDGHGFLDGFVNGYTFNPNFEEGSFIDKKGRILPKIIDISLDFTPILSRLSHGYNSTTERFQNPNYPYSTPWKPGNVRHGSLAEGAQGPDLEEMVFAPEEMEPHITDLKNDEAFKAISKKLESSL